MSFAYHLNVPMPRSLATVAALLAILAAPAAAQFPRLAPPPPCRATIAAPALLTHWAGGPARDSRPKVAVFNLEPEIDDAARVYLAVAVPERIRQRLSREHGLRVAPDGSVSRAMYDAKSRTDSAAVLLGADFLITGRLLIVESRQEVELVLNRRGQVAPAWRASFRATTSLRTIEDAAVRGLARAMGLRGVPGTPKGWPVTDEGHAALLAGDTHLRSSFAGTDSAIFYYERGLDAEPGSSVAATRLARAYVMTLDRGREIPGFAGTAGPRRVNELLDRAFASDSSAEVWTIRGMLARTLDPVRFKGALDAHLRAVSANPRDAEAEHEYGVTLLRLGDNRGAETHFRRALAIEPSRPATFATLAWMELQESDWKSACVLSNASIAAWPYDPLPYAVRAEARLKLADARDAFSDAELVRRLATGAWPAALRLLITHGSSNVDETRVQVMALTANWLAPGSQLGVRDAEYLARAYLAMGDQRRAIESLRRARPIGADLGVTLRSPKLAAIRKDTAVVRMLAEAEGRGLRD